MKTNHVDPSKKCKEKLRKKRNYPLKKMKKEIIWFILSQVQGIKQVVVGYYAPWGQVEPKDLPYDKVTHINYAFATATDKSAPADIQFDEGYNGARLDEIIKRSKPLGVKVILSIGGWTGGQTLSLVAKDVQLRTQFINNAIKFVTSRDLDGIDIDWEYPGRRGVKCSAVNLHDTENYLLLLKELRFSLDKQFPLNKKLITAAVRAKPFDGPSGKPLKDVSQFAKYFDFVNIMAYDLVNTLSDKTGPNAPFTQDPKRVEEPLSFTQSINDWLAAGIPANQITAGLAFYGHSYTASKDMSRDLSNQYVDKENDVPRGDRSDAKESNSLCDEGVSYSGVYKYKFLRSDILKNNPYKSEGYIRQWDNVTQTPWLFNRETKHYISYDDPFSLKIKVDFARCKGLLGVMYWDMSQDYNNELIDAVNSNSEHNSCEKFKSLYRVQDYTSRCDFRPCHS